MTLNAKKCTPCQGGIPPLEKEEAEKLLTQTPNWQLIDDATKLKREFEFKNFAESWDFINEVGKISEEENHHPDINFGWGYAIIEIYTHKINGLHENDFILAAKIDKI